MFIARFFEESYGRRRNSKMRDFILIDYFPEAIGSRIVGHALIEHHTRTKLEGADQLPRPHHPADVGVPKEAIVRMHVEAVSQLFASGGENTKGRVDAGFRFSRGARSIEKETF